MSTAFFYPTFTNVFFLIFSTFFNVFLIFISTFITSMDTGVSESGFALTGCLSLVQASPARVERSRSLVQAHNSTRVY